ncbi:diaminopimelate epimerase [Candidatus Nitrosoglobus terrae]|uniref:Diaminopimelate epimerase n=1 Tax=Candidatus Nitrosoglobus terrae TaxID=1630141 RepID=A0A1Q2SPP1_9GAMM|nr:diaminopimelate epimerase [Candidatus Nitrosoglobus terrae]BAW81092.1 diaminopimelate epimerase [Candidatus Nitrosoglobus terrae]
MNITFTKMHGLGNDFVVIDTVSQPLSLTTSQVRRIADRRLGVGCDQILLVTQPPSTEVDFGYRIFNADGSEVEQCGNGARCFARFVRDQGLTDKDNLRVQTVGGVIHLQLESDGQVTVNMGIPRFAPEQIPFKVDCEADVYSLAVDGQCVEVSIVSMGNPHCVLRVPTVHSAPVLTLGPMLEKHPRFPQRVNVGFMQIISFDHIQLRVYERGTGETPACGTGACAAVVIGKRRGWLSHQVKVDLPGGRLSICWEGDNKPVWMTGPVETVFKGSITL